MIDMHFKRVYNGKCYLSVSRVAGWFPKSLLFSMKEQNGARCDFSIPQVHCKAANGGGRDGAFVAHEGFLTAIQTGRCVS